MTQKYPKRLIEVDLPIKRISAHARREKSIRHGHISTLHIWWARRPLAACRAVICASLWPDPVDPLCPQVFRDKASKIIFEFARAAANKKELGESCDHETWIKWQALAKTDGLDGRKEAHWNILRFALLDFIADFANWDNSTVQEYLDTSRALTQAAHEALGGEPGTRPLVVDPFAGGGAIPLEALRVGADVFASDLNPVAVLLNKVVLEYVPKYGKRLSDEVRKWGDWVRKEAYKELTQFYPTDPDGSTPIAYLWSRTIQCEGPACGAELPLIRSLWLSKKGKHKSALRLVVNPDAKRIDFDILQDSGSRVAQAGTMKKGAATCPICGYTTPNPRVREQLAGRVGGADTARLICVVVERASTQGRFYRLANDRDMKAFDEASLSLSSCRSFIGDGYALSPFPQELIPAERPSPNARGLSAVTRIGVTTFGDLYSARQKLALHVFAKTVQRAADRVAQETGDDILAAAIATCVSLVFTKMAGLCSSFNRWEPNVQCVQDVFGRQAVGLVWDFAESNPLGNSRGSFNTFLDGTVNLLGLNQGLSNSTTPQQANACAHPLPDDSAECIATDPPYFDSVPYADLSDYFYVWLKRSLCSIFPELRTESATPKDEEAIWNPGRITKAGVRKDEAFYRSQIMRAFAEARRVSKPSGIATVVFAHKSTAGWEAILSALLEAGWTVTASWPIDTELGSRVNAQGTASLASSVHLVCRPREQANGSADDDGVGDWREVLQELPIRIHEWMPRLASEGVVGADAIFACLGPALEVFSRYSRVEKASGEPVALGEYLEHVWAAVAKEALALVFEGADATGFEADARLTAMWLWTLKSPDSNGKAEDVGDDEDSDDEQEGKKPKITGFKLEYDAARKIAQGLGAHLESLTHLVEVSGDQARLLPVSERTKHLFGKDEEEPSQSARKKKASAQLNMFAELTEGEDAEVAWKEKTVKRVGETTLDRVHQAMILFAAGRGEALKRFVVEDGVGQDGKFWRLAQALSALYPSGTDEKRWVDGVLARKKQFGF
jgi:adenine-specific DNA methylase